MTAGNDLHSAFAAVGAALDEAGAQAAAGAAVDLAGLDARVAALCESVQALPREAGAGFVADLERLSATLDALAATLKCQQDALAGETPHSARQRAAAAYGVKAPPPEAP